MMTLSIDDVPALEGTHNFRSLAGTPTTGGRRIAAHRLLRSDRLNRVGPAGWKQLMAMGLRTICDLRSQEEVVLAPTNVPPELPVRTLHLDIRNDVRGDASLARTLAADPTPFGARRLMLEIYRRLPAVIGPRLQRLLDVLCAEAQDGAPVLVHCAAGKDRTGFVIAVLLHALGVHKDDVMADYLRAPPSRGTADPRLAYLQQHLQGALTGFELPIEALVPVLDVEPAYLEAAWQVLDENYGGVMAYLQQVAGFNAARQKALQECLLVPC